MGVTKMRPASAAVSSKKALLQRKETKTPRPSWRVYCLSLLQRKETKTWRGRRAHGRASCCNEKKPKQQLPQRCASLAVEPLLQAIRAAKVSAMDWW